MVLTLTFLLLANTVVPIELPPPTALALDIAEAIGATTRDLQLAADPTITPAETDALVDALRRTGLFALTATQPTAIVRLRRVDPGVILATVEKPDGERLWVGRAIWPKTEEQTPKTEAPKTADDDLIDRVAEYRRRRLTVMSVASTTWIAPILVGGGRGWEAGISAGDFAPGASPAPASSTTANWVLMRGSAQVLDELEFAKVIQDHELVRAVEESRSDMRLKWLLGFGGVAVAAIATGIGLYFGAPAVLFENSPQLRTNMQTIGVSVAVLGAASAVAALFFRTVGTSPIQPPSEAERRCDAYNTRLIRQLRLRQKDLVATPAK